MKGARNSPGRRLIRKKKLSGSWREKQKKLSNDNADPKLLSLKNLVLGSLVIFLLFFPFFFGFFFTKVGA